MPANDKGSAEDRFRAAFERIKSDTPTHIAKGSALTQNNIAREAGLDPSALKKSRFPDLISEIQRWKSSERPEPSKVSLKVKNAKRPRELKQKLLLMKKQRDRALQLLAEADALILILDRKLEEAGIFSDSVDRPT